MVKGYSPLEGSQEDINRRLYRMIQNAEAGDATAIKALQDAIGSETTANTILKRIKDVEGAIGADDTTAGSLKKRCKDIENVIGSESTADTILKRIKDIETAIGTESTEGTILYRIKQLEPSG